MSWTYPPNPQFHLANESVESWVGIPGSLLRQVNPKLATLISTRAADEDVDAIVEVESVENEYHAQNFYTSWWLHQPRQNGNKSSPIFGVKMKYI